jgi:hypothetical protein
MLRRSVVTMVLAGVLLMGWAFEQPVASGELRGHLKILSMKEAEAADGRVPGVTAEMYAQYPLVVLSADGKQTVSVVTANAQGSYKAELPPGSYLLDVQERVRKHVRARPVPFTITAGQTAHVNLEMDTGVR